MNGSPAQGDGPRPADNLRERVECYKVRIEELDRSFFSYRMVEWRTALQFLSGYVAVGLIFDRFHPQKLDPAWLLPAWCLVLLGIGFAAFLFFRWCIHARLMYTQRMRRAYVAEMHRTAGVAQLAAEDAERPRFSGWYGFAIQLLIHLLVVVTIAGYVIKASWL